MPLGPSGFVIQTPFGMGADFTMTMSGTGATLNVYTALLDGTGTPIEAQAVAGGTSVSATVTSGNTNVGTITTSPVLISGGSFYGTTQFQPVGAGTATITASAAGYGSNSVQATVQGATLSIANGATVGQYLENQNTLILSAAAPSQGLQVILTSNNPSLLKLAVNATDPGSNTITLNMSAGAQIATYYVYALGSSGSATYTATAPGYGSGSDTVYLAPSAILILGPGGCPGSCTVSLSGGAQSLMVITDALSTDGQNTPDPNAIQPLAGNVALTVTLGNTNRGAGTVPGSASIAGGQSSGTVTFTDVATGSTTVSVSRPTGWTAPGLYSGINLTQVVITVQ
jgi:hypothetical protein